MVDYLNLNNYLVDNSMPADVVQEVRDDFVRAIAANPGGDFSTQGGLRLAHIAGNGVRAAVKHWESVVGMTCNTQWCSCRLQKADGSFQIRWHQDLAALRLRPGLKGLVIWMFLDPLDGTRPSLEIAKPIPAVEHVRDGQNFLVSPKLDDCKGVILKNLPMGAAAMFSPFAPHRTHWTPDMTNNRYSIDFRFRSDWTPTNLPHDTEVYTHSPGLQR